jgi:type III secretion system low calcium response chaperone LcrH/SycD
MAEKENIIIGYDVNDPKQKEALVRHLRDEYLAGHPMRETLHVADYQLEQVYAIAYRQYQAGDYKKAADTFQYLLFFDDQRYKYVLGFAASLHKLKQYSGALAAYQLAAVQMPLDPVPMFHMADCYIHSGHPDKAATCLEMVIRMATRDSRYAELAERARLIKEGLSSKKHPPS